MPRFYKPLIALALAIIPFFLFLGISNTTSVNGQIVSDSRLNLGGLLMAVIGLGLAFAVLRPSAPKDAARKALAALAGLLCLVQIANSLDVIRIDPLDWILPDRDLPALTYSGLAENEKTYLSSNTPETYRWALTGQKSNIVAQAGIHQAYADLCHAGRYRLDLERAERIPHYFNADEQAEISRVAAGRTAAGPGECTPARSQRLMGEAVDELNRDMDLFDRLEAEYLALPQ